MMPGLQDRQWRVSGTTGQIGHHSVTHLHTSGAQVVALASSDRDTTDRAAVDAAIAEHRQWY